MISTANVSSVTHFSISCITGERSPAQVDLDIRRDNKIFILSKQPNFKVHKRGNRAVAARDFRDFDHIGIFYCESKQGVIPSEKITMINNFNRGEKASPSYGPYRLVWVSFTVHLARYLHIFAPHSQFCPGRSHTDGKQRGNRSPQHAATRLWKERCDLEIQW